VIDKPRYRDIVTLPVSTRSMRWIGYANVSGEYRPAVNRKQFDYVHIVGMLAIGNDWEPLEIQR
jgi:hypothetical protein